MLTIHQKTLAVLAVLAASSMIQAQTSTGASAPQDVVLTGTTQFDLWNDVSAGTNGAHGGFPGFAPWPGAIGSNLGGDAGIIKTANGTGGGPYASSGSIYFGGTSSVANNFGGTLTVTDATPVADLNTVVFQLQIVEAWGYDLFNDLDPVLNFNGGAQNIAATWRNTPVRELAGTFPAPTGNEPLYKNLHALQWDLSSVTDPITSVSISFSGVQHAQVYGLRLDQCSAIYSAPVPPVAVPEPATMAALGLGVAALIRRRKKS